MTYLSKEEFEKIIEENKDSIYVICAGNGILKNSDCAAWISTSEKSAKDFFDSIVNNLPENMK